jgi:hypothetical protein
LQHPRAKLRRKNVQKQNSSKCARNVQQRTTGDSAYSTLTSAAFRRSKRGLPQVSRRRRQIADGHFDVLLDRRQLARRLMIAAYRTAHVLM